MNLYLIHASETFTFCIGQEDAAQTFVNYYNQYGGQTNVAIVTDLTDVTRNFDSNASNE